MLRHAQGGVDGVGVDLLATLQPLVERQERGPSDIGGLLRARDRQPITPRHQRDTERAFDALEMLVVLAEELRQQGVVGELEIEARLGVARGIARGQATASGSAPARLLGSTIATRTVATEPKSASGAAAWTGCSHGLRPASWPGWRPRFSNSTSTVRPAKPALKRVCCSPSKACNAARRSTFTGSGTWSSRAAAGVPGRALYLNENA